MLILIMESVGEASFLDHPGGQIMCSEPQPGEEASSWAHLLKPITVIVMGSLMSAVGALLFLFQSFGPSDSTRSVASACVSIGLMFVVVGLVWTPILKEKRQRKRFIQGACTEDGNDSIIRSFLSVSEDYTSSPAAAGALGLFLNLDSVIRRTSKAIMSTFVQVEPLMEKKYDGVGRCKCSFWFAVAHDILGVFIMMVGVFGGLPIHDLFIYSGAIVIFLSLIWWVFWYSGNIDVPPEELEDDVGLTKLKNRGFSRVVRQASQRLSNRIRNSFRSSRRSTRENPARTNRDANMETSLSTIFDGSIYPLSENIVREPLSI